MVISWLSLQYGYIMVDPKVWLYPGCPYSMVISWLPLQYGYIMVVPTVWLYHGAGLNSWPFSISAQRSPAHWAPHPSDEDDQWSSAWAWRRSTWTSSGRYFL